jgi:hypothetical protein
MLTDGTSIQAAIIGGILICIVAALFLAKG